MRVLSEADVAKLIQPELAIRSAEEAYAAFSGGTAQIPPRGEIHRRDPDGTALVMCGLIGNSTLGVKLVGSVVADRNSSRRNTTCLIVIWDAATLIPRGLISADALNDHRTAAGLAMATKLLARPDSRTHVLFGTGKLAYPSALYIAYVLPIRRLIVVGRTRVNTEMLVQALQQNKSCEEIEIACDLAPDEAAAEADVITTVTRSAHPLFDGGRVRSGTHLNVAGAMRRHEREIDDRVASRSHFFLDSEAVARQRAGDLVLPIEAGILTEDRIGGEIGEVILGRRPGRTDAAQITVFRSMGIASQDLCLGAALLDEAEARGVGQEVRL
jgi:alanine dehydrogenase